MNWLVGFSVFIGLSIAEIFFETIEGKKNYARSVDRCAFMYLALLIYGIVVSLPL